MQILGFVAVGSVLFYGICSGNVELIEGALISFIALQIPREVALFLSGAYKDPKLPPWYKRLFHGQVWFEQHTENKRKQC